MESTRVIQAERLMEHCQDLLECSGVPVHQAKLIADTLVEANLRGVDSHGVVRLSNYIERLQKGVVQAKTEVRTAEDFGAVALLDAEHGMGQIASFTAMEMALEKAEKLGIGAVGVRNSHHFGMASYYSVMAAKQGMIGISLSNTTPLMPPTGGTSARLGNNPLAIAVPSSQPFPVVLDMALSQVAYGKILMASQKNQMIPDGWGTDDKGNPTNDPQAVLGGGFLLPAGGAKGYGLAFFIDILSGVLTGSGFGDGVKSLYRNFEEPNRCGHFFIAINVRPFSSLPVFDEAIRRYIAYIRQTPRAEGIEEIFIPGEMEYQVYKERKKTGIPIDSVTYNDLASLAEQVGMRGELR